MPVPLFAGGRVTRSLLMVSNVVAFTRAFLLPFADHFRALGWKVDALSNGISGCEICRPHFDAVHEVRWSREPFDFRNHVRGLRTVRGLAASRDYDIIHVHTPIPGFLTRLALAWPSKRPKPAVVYTAHGFHFHPTNTWIRNKVFARLEKLAGSWTDYLVTINKTDWKAAAELKLVPDDRLLYMPGIGIDLTHFRPDAVLPKEVQLVRSGFGLEEDEPAFTMIAEFIDRKRHRDALRALARMRNQTAHLMLVGDGPTRESVRALASSLGILSRVHFAGRQSDVRPYILASRATILPSSQEGLPRCVMESLSCGVPVVGSDIRGTRDVLSEGGGLLFPKGDDDALASQLDSVLESPDEATQIGTRGRNQMSIYNLANIISQHENLYAEIRPRR